MEEKDYMEIPREKFEFAQMGENLHDEKFKTKARGYFADAFIRFSKNKSSVAAAIIIILLMIFSILSPIISKYKVSDKENVYVNLAPFVPSIAEKNLGIWDGGVTLSSQNDNQITALHAIGTETGYDPVIKILGTTETKSIYRGKERISYSYKVKVNTYYQIGIKLMTISYSEFEDIMKFQDETGLQVLFPMVDKAKAYPESQSSGLDMISDNPNIWYVCSDSRSTPVKDASGNLVPAYCTDASKEGMAYTSQRIAGDDGSYIYSYAKSGSVQCRICYYNYYVFKNGHEAEYIFGTDTFGRDLFCAMGMGARFSIVFAILVASINLTIGAIYGSIQGYYGGAIDLAMDRVTDILNGIPFIVVTTLFQIHLAGRVGIIPAFLFAFVLTGWIGMAALTRKQFYRFKGQEYVLAARTLGASDRRIMFKHIFPNSLGTIVTSCALVIPGVISSETSLTYLGIVDLSSFVGTSIGELMSHGQASMTTSPHAMFFPALFVSLLLITFNLFGNGLRDAFNPSTRGTED